MPAPSMEAPVMPRFVRSGLGLFIALMVIGGPIGYAHYREKQFRNFRVVEEGVLLTRRRSFARHRAKP